ncbi:MAG: hypothetical protein ACLP3K_13790 [Candidatus Acidiferrales bacterium]
MRGKILIRVGVAAGALIAIAAQVAPAKPAAGTAASGCDRACLDGFVDRYLDAVAANDPSRLPVTPTVKFTEDGQRLNLGDGLWNTATGKGTYKFYMEDVQAGEAGFFGTMREAGEPVILSLRLKIEDQKIAEIETIVNRDKTEAENLEKRGHPDPLFTETIPAADRVSRAELVKAANMYFSGMQLNDGKGSYPFTDDCDRVENGAEATNNHSADTSNVLASQGNSIDNARRRADLSYSAEWGCKEQFESGLLHFVTRIRDRRFVVVDPERGVALAWCFFDHAAGKTRTFQIPDGRTVTVGPVTPWTWEISEVFRVEHGKIRRIEAVYHRGPYGMGSGWSSWQDAMSTVARWSPVSGKE